MSGRMTDDPQLKGIILSILDRLSPALGHAKDFSKEKYPDDDDP